MEFQFIILFVIQIRIQIKSQMSKIKDTFDKFSSQLKGRTIKKLELIKLLNQVISDKPQYLYLLSFLNRFQKQDRFNFDQIFGNEQSMQQLLSKVNGIEYIPLLIKYYKNSKQILKKYLSKSVFQLKSQEKQFSIVSDQDSKKKNLQQQFYEKVNTLYILFKQLNLSNEIDSNILIRWVAFVKGQNQKQINLINLIIKEFKQDKSLSIKILIELSQSNLYGSGNMVLILSRINSPILSESIIKNSTSQSIGLILKGLVKDCMPSQFLLIVEEIINKLIVKKDYSALNSIFDNLIKQVLFPSMSNSIHYEIIQRLIKNLLNKYSNFKLTMDQYDKFTQKINIEHTSNFFYFWQFVAEKLLKSQSKIAVQHLNFKNQAYKSHISTNSQIQNKSQIKYASTISKINPQKSQIKDSKMQIQNQKTNDNFSGGSTVKKSLISQVYNRQSSKISENEKHIIFESSDFIGIPNIGNSCYINSFLQSLYYYDQFSECIMSIIDQEDYVAILRKIFVGLKLHQKNDLQKNIRLLRKAISLTYDNQYQQDSMQFGRELIEKLISNKSLKQKMSKIFQIKLTQIFMCQSHQSHRRQYGESYLILSFQNPKIFSKIKFEGGNKVKLSDMIQTYFAEDVRQGQFVCQTCKKKINKLNRKYKFNGLPKLWIIALSRFTFDKQTLTKKKIFDKVIIQDYLFLNEIKSINRDANYRLNSFVNHMGKSAESGHYQAYVRHPSQADRWLNFDDDYVTQSVYKNVSSMMQNFDKFDTPYVLFYERIK